MWFGITAAYKELPAALRARTGRPAPPGAHHPAPRRRPRRARPVRQLRQDPPDPAPRPSRRARRLGLLLRPQRNRDVRHVRHVRRDVAELSAPSERYAAGTDLQAWYEQHADTCEPLPLPGCRACACGGCRAAPSPVHGCNRCVCFDEDDLWPAARSAPARALRRPTRPRRGPPLWRYVSRAQTTPSAAWSPRCRPQGTADPRASAPCATARCTRAYLTVAVPDEAS